MRISEPTASVGTAVEPRTGVRAIPAASADSALTYLSQLGATPLLTAPQEVDLAMRIECGRMATALVADTNGDPLDRRRFGKVVEAVVSIRTIQLDPEKGLRREGIGRETVLSGHWPRVRAEAIAFLHRVAADEPRARRKMIEANLRLVISIAKRFVGQGLMLMDLTQEGNLGLMHAVDKFDYRHGCKFSTYATWWIRQAVSRAIADKGRTIRVPAHVAEHIHKVHRARQDLVQTLGREPEPKEIAERIHLPEKQVRKILDMRSPVSLETPVGEDDGLTVGDSVEDPDAEPPPEAAGRAMLRVHVEAILDTLDDRERGIVQKRFGLLGGEPETLAQVAKVYGVSRERIRQIEARTMCKLSHPARAEKLRDYLD
jgi:RNA polymerase sigma factor (sigma-70 family)